MTTAPVPVAPIPCRHPRIYPDVGASRGVVSKSSGSGSERPADSDAAERTETAEPETVEARLDDALERVAHGATVSVPSILLQRGLTVAFTAVLTNGFGAGPYGLFALARRIQRILIHLAMGFGSGLSRFLPNADTDAERNAIATFAAALMLAVGTAFAVALFLAAPWVTRMAGQGPQFRLFVRVFAAGIPAVIWLFAVAGMLRGIEAVVPLNLTQRLGFPVAQLLVGVVGTLLFEDLALVAAGVMAATGLVGVLAAGWLARRRGFRPRLRGPDLPELRRRYLRFTLPMFAAGFATTVQRLGFYPLIALFLTGVAAGVFAVGVLVGTLVRLPLMGINQFIPPVAAALHEEDHREALKRLYHVTSRLVLVGVTGLAVPVIVYRKSVMGLFGPEFVAYAGLLPLFILAQYGACAAGSVGILLMMTDNQRALLVINVVVTTILVAAAVPLTLRFGLWGVVASYLLMLTLNNGLEVAVLYYLEGLQPFTRRHAKPLAAAVPLAAVAFAVRGLVSGWVAFVAGSVLGLVAYALALRTLGFTHVERRLGATMVERYRNALDL